MKEVVINVEDLKNLKRIINKNKRKEVKLLLNYNTNLYDKPNKNLEEYKEYLEVIEAFNIKDKKERLSYIYDNLCNYFDRDMRENNYCEFENGTCIANRLGYSVHSDNGCCYRRRKLCEHLTSKGCTNPNPTCKIFMCSYLNEIKKVPNYNTKKILITSCLLPERGHYFFRRNYFITKKEFIEKYMKRIPN